MGVAWNLCCSNVLLLKFNCSCSWANTNIKKTFSFCLCLVRTNMTEIQWTTVQPIEVLTLQLLQIFEQGPRQWTLALKQSSCGLLKKTVNPSSEVCRPVQILSGGKKNRMRRFMEKIAKSCRFLWNQLKAFDRVFISQIWAKMYFCVSTFIFRVLSSCKIKVLELLWAHSRLSCKRWIFKYLFEKKIYMLLLNKLKINSLVSNIAFKHWGERTHRTHTHMLHRRRSINISRYWNASSAINRNWSKVEKNPPSSTV